MLLKSCSSTKGYLQSICLPILSTKTCLRRGEGGLIECQTCEKKIYVVKTILGKKF